MRETDGPAGSRIDTIRKLRAAIDGLSDDTPLIVNAAFEPGFADEQFITGAGFGLVNWGDGYGMEQDSVFALDCHPAAGEDVRRKPVRPPKDGP